MSRTGHLPIEIPEDVRVKLDGNTIEAEGPQGELSHTVDHRLTVDLDDGQISISRPTDRRLHKELHGLHRGLVVNMVQGVKEGFQKELEIIGTGYRAMKQGNNLVLQVGFSHPVEMEIPAGLEVEIPSATRIRIRGADKQLVGQFAADVREVKKPEPYQGKGIRYAGEQVRRKEGKTATTSTTA